MKRFIYLLLTLLCIFALSSCSAGIGSTTVLHNDEIEKSISNDLAGMNERLIRAIQNNDSQAIISMGGQDLRSKSTEIKEIVPQICKDVKNSSFSRKDDYYIKVSKLGDYNFTATSSLTNREEFLFTLDALGKEMYLSLWTSDDKVASTLLSSIYYKKNGKWELAGFYTGNYSIQGLNAINCYDKAKELLAKGYEMPAFLYMDLGNRVLRPAPFLQYKNESDFNSFKDEVLENIRKKYKFPIKIDSVSNEPQICLINVINVDEGIVPYIRYKSNLSLKDSVGLGREAENITVNIDKIFPGISENFDFIAYHAYSEFPSDPNKQYNCYGTTVNLKTKKKR